MEYLRPVNPTGIVLLCRRWEDATARRRWARRMLLSPAIARPGYWFVTACALLWGGALSLGRLRRESGVIVAHRMPRWSFGRGGTTLGAVYLTHDNEATPVLEHEAVHREQWKKYGLSFIPLYVAAGVEAATNRFEVEAGLSKGNYGERNAG